MKVLDFLKNKFNNKELQELKEQNEALIRENEKLKKLVYDIEVHYTTLRR